MDCGVFHSGLTAKMLPDQRAEAMKACLKCDLSPNKENSLALVLSASLSSSAGTGDNSHGVSEVRNVRMSEEANNREDKFLTGEEFRIWRRARGLSLAETASWFGLTYQAIQRWERTGLSQVQALALSAIDRGLKPWRPTEVDYKEAGVAEETNDGDGS